MDLVRFVVAGQHIHDKIDAEAHRHFALWLAARNHSEGGAALRVDCPGAGPVVGADNDAGDAVVDPVLDRLDPQCPDIPAPRKIVHKVEGFGQHMIGRDRNERRHLDPRHQSAKALCRRYRTADRAGGLIVGVARVEQDRAAGIEVPVDPFNGLWRRRPLA